MNIAVIGSGYVGLVTGCCLAEVGNHVVCVDHDTNKIATLKAGHVPFHEPGLTEVLNTQLAAGRLTFETSIARAMENADLVFLAIGTPPDANGNANLDNLLHCAHELTKTPLGDCIVVVKSTVPVGTGDRIEKLLNKHRSADSRQHRIRVASNPEFLAEGRAVDDFRHPDRIVIGSDDRHTALMLANLYAPFDNDGERLLFMDRRSAEFAKYACNAMLAARISMVNELAGLAGNLGADVTAICKVLKGDPRIGASYLYPGIGYGGSCLPKDLHALINFAQEMGEPADILRSVQRVNQRQVQHLLTAIRDYLGDLTGKRIAIWGLSFKPDTDDVRAAPSLALIQDLVEHGALVSAYDPVAMDTARHALGDTSVIFGKTALDVCENADALVVMTEWEQFKNPDFDALFKCMNDPIIFDARILYHTETLQHHGFQHCYLGKSRLPAQAVMSRVDHSRLPRRREGQTTRDSAASYQ